MLSHLNTQTVVKQAQGIPIEVLLLKVYIALVYIYTDNIKVSRI